MVDTVAKGREGEKRAREWLLAQGFKVKFADSPRSPYDLLATKDGVTYAIQVKYGEKVYALDKTNIEELFNLRKQYVPIFLFIVDESIYTLVFSDMVTVDIASMVAQGVVPRRGTRRFTVSLPADQTNLIDVCSEALGISRSAFLQLFLDYQAKKMVSFTDDWLRRSQITAEFPKGKEGK